LAKQNNAFINRRNQQNEYWLLETINQQLKERFYQHPLIKKELQKEILLIEAQKTTPFVAAKKLLALSLQNRQ